MRKLKSLSRVEIRNMDSWHFPLDHSRAAWRLYAFACPDLSPFAMLDIDENETKRFLSRYLDVFRVNPDRKLALLVDAPWTHYYDGGATLEPLVDAGFLAFNCKEFAKQGDVLWTKTVERLSNAQRIVTMFSNAHTMA
jgi:hypothetical protein